MNGVLRVVIVLSGIFFFFSLLFMDVFILWNVTMFCSIALFYIA